MRRWLVRRIVEYLTQPLPFYERRGWNDPDSLRRRVRKGDVVLVDGDQRVSSIIKYLTQSCWSHSALYVGDELLARGGEVREQALDEFGDEAGHLVVEALPEGVVAAPLLKYVDYNLRVCRPLRLRSEHLRRIMDEATAAIGWRYDLRNLLDLARYTIPVRIVPNRWRRTALHFGSGQPTEVICSSLIGRLFQQVRYPVLPTVSFPDGGKSPHLPRRGRGMLGRVFGHESPVYTGIFRMRHPTLLTPRDFDLSPYFEVVKFNVVADGFDYERIRWADLEPEEETPASAGRADRALGAEN